MIHPTKEWDVLIIKASGIALVTMALTWLPVALGSMVQIFAVTWCQVSAYSGDGGYHELMTSLNIQTISSAVGEIVAFFILLVLARWVFGYPQILRRAFQRTSQQPRETDAERDNPPIDR